jgi:hypothetical protein
MQVLSNEEHMARALLLGRVFDMLTHTYRYLSPEGSKYKYTDCLHADTLEVMPKGSVRDIEQEHRKGNIVSGLRTPGAKNWRVKKSHKFGQVIGYEAY